MNAVQKLRQLVDTLRSPSGVPPGTVAESWALAERLLGRLAADPKRLSAVCAARDIDGLDALVSALERPPSARAGGNPPAPAKDAASELEPQMEAALRAFRKRLKLTRLSDESRLSGRRLTSGKPSEIDAIIPPAEFPPEVWKALARAGRLKDMEDGFYGLP